MTSPDIHAAPVLGAPVPAAPAAAAAAVTPAGAAREVHGDQPVLPEQSREDTDIAWGDYPHRGDEDRFARDRPPHWADY